MRSCWKSATNNAAGAREEIQMNTMSEGFFTMNSKDLNMTPRVVTTHGASTRRCANLWALAKALRYLHENGVSHSFNMEKYGAYVGEDGIDQNANLCGTPACAAGFGYQLRIGRDAGVSMYPKRYTSYISYTRAHLTGDEESLVIWLFSGGWILSDNTMTGAADRIGFYLCHPEDIEYRDFASDMHTAHYRPSTLFTRWRAAFNWDVVPEIPGAMEAAERALANADLWIRQAQVAGRYELEVAQ